MDVFATALLFSSLKLLAGPLWDKIEMDSLAQSHSPKTPHNPLCSYLTAHGLFHHWLPEKMVNVFNVYQTERGLGALLFFTYMLRISPNPTGCGLMAKVRPSLGLLSWCSCFCSYWSCLLARVPHHVTQWFIGTAEVIPTWRGLQSLP